MVSPLHVGIFRRGSTPSVPRSLSPSPGEAGVRASTDEYLYNSAGSI